VVSTSSTTGPLPALPESVEGSSGDFSLVLSFGGSKRKNIEGESLLFCLMFLKKPSGIHFAVKKIYLTKLISYF